MEEIPEIMQFETKPKSAAIEYVPKKVLAYIEKNREQLSRFLNNKTCYEQFM